MASFGGTTGTQELTLSAYSSLIVALGLPPDSDQWETSFAHKMAVFNIRHRQQMETTLAIWADRIQRSESDAFQTLQRAVSQAMESANLAERMWDDVRCNSYPVSEAV